MDTTSRTIRDEELLAHMGWVRSLARSLLGDSDVAEDVTQETWLRARTGAACTQPSTLRAWLGAVTRTLARDSRRASRRRVRREHAASHPEAQPSTYEVVERTALQQSVTEAVMTLPEPYRSTILYRHLDDLDTREIAERMQVTAEVVRQRLTRGRRTLRDRLDRKLGGDSRSGLLAILGVGTPAAIAPAAVGVLGTPALTSLLGGLVFAAAIGGWQLSHSADGRPGRLPDELSSSTARLDAAVAQVSPFRPPPPAAPAVHESPDNDVSGSAPT